MIEHGDEICSGIDRDRLPVEAIFRKPDAPHDH
jgi:hypothetical protein